MCWGVVKCIVREEIHFVQSTTYGQNMSEEVQGNLIVLKGYILIFTAMRLLLQELLGQSDSRYSQRLLRKLKFGYETTLSGLYLKNLGAIFVILLIHHISGQFTHDHPIVCQAHSLKILVLIY